MAGDFEITGGEQLRVLGARLSVADRQLRLKLGRNLRAATKPVIDKQRAAALARLPKSGGLNRLVAGSKIGTRVTLAGRNVGVRITAKNVDNIVGIDKGKVRHLTFGKPPWQSQEVEAGWFTDPADESKPEMTAAATEAIAETLRELK